MSSYPSTKSDIEGGIFYFGIPIFSYTELEEATNKFDPSKELGDGGFGTVYHGNLRDGREVAIKRLYEHNYRRVEQFLNEIKILTALRHPNLVSLYGFCFEGCKRALIYEFMPNGSLEKFITNTASQGGLGWQKLFEIALGIARGLDYLHQGCKTRILHFDIKPHNILLDEDFNPRISDFGLSRLCPNRSSIVSMMVARGTIGYIAPEVFCRNFGEVSHKSDVYSYGMMVLEMTGGKKNIDRADVDCSSEIYFPAYIYKQLEMNGNEEDTLAEIMNEDESQFAKRRLMIVGLWCIQTDPKDRPSMTKVVEMLEADSKCPPSFRCRNFTLQFPFTDIKHLECGLLPVEGCNNYEYLPHPRFQIGSGQFPKYIDIIRSISGNSVLMDDSLLQASLQSRSCLALSKISLTDSPSVSFTFSPNLTFFTCFKEEQHFKDYKSKDCNYSYVYYANNDSVIGDTSDIPPGCSLVQLPKSNNDSGDLFDQLSARFTVEWNVSEDCSKCYRGGGQCLTDNQNQFYCKQGANNSRWKLILALSVSGAGILMLLLITYIIWLRKKYSSKGYLPSRDISSMTSNPTSKSDIKGGIFYFGIPVFSYAELEEATNNFDPSKELGDGGFGTVYHGNLWDGREVAIKRLFEHNFKGVNQFLNEIKILTGLRHPNLMSLYGCTSRTSRELLLVYEFVSNGTVADHLHGERSKEEPLTWTIRMKIALETATALAYLHKSDIIHRDVKTNNILLDSNYCVKIGDFGLSRLLPENVTHISTVPQGTPGYVDPEYHQYYQLTDKSDVYSFGVVLIELISSMPAVDINRHRNEINLANLALNRIQRCAFDELIDPSLGYESDPEVRRMTTTVAELAFRCLQVDKDFRPSMDEVVDSLSNIQGGEDCKFEQRKQGDGDHTAPGKIPPSPETDDVFLLKNENFQASSTAVTDAWASSASTITSSID
ncbi:hypothetical protein ACS0TY_034132 [Phlomoides rotata]